jgi:hypothetical protein
MHFDIKGIFYVMNEYVAKWKYLKTWIIVGNGWKL